MSGFNKNRYRAIIGDCFDPKPAIFWRDLLIAYVLLGLGAYLYLSGEHLAIQGAGFVLGALMAYRCASYIHEIVHLPKARFKNFILGWNALVGVPFLTPSVLYESHLDHHIPRKYATRDDPEYLALAGRGSWPLVWFVIHHAFVTPLILYVRMLVGLPVRLISRKGASYLDRRLSSLVINWHYDRRNQSKSGLLMLMEAYVLAVTAAISFLVVSGIIDPLLIPKLVVMIMAALILNGIRTLAAHRYANHALEAVNGEEQLLDSLNYDGPRWFGGLMAPVGLRFHALHHLFPTLPYHNLEAAHRALMAELPADDPYRKTVFTGFLAQLREMKADRSGTIAGAVEGAAEYSESAA